jgi:hypothetical protein
MRKLSMDELNRLSVEDFKQTDKMPFIVVLENIRSAYNTISSTYSGTFTSNTVLTISSPTINMASRLEHKI